MKTLPWFRMYHESLDDEKLRLLACEDRWHFVALLCCKAKGILDDGGALLRRKVAVKLGLSTNELDEVARRLAEVGLINHNTLQPIAWDVRQMQSDKDETNAQRQQRYREAHKAGVTHSNALRNAPVTRIDTDTEEDKEVDKKNTRAVAPPEGVAPSLWTDFKKLRAAKKAAITDTAIQGISREAVKAGISLSDALTMCCERGWIAFRADWYENAMTAKPAAMTARNNTHKYAGAAAAIWGNDTDERVINV